MNESTPSFFRARSGSVHRTAVLALFTLLLSALAGAQNYGASYVDLARPLVVSDEVPVEIRLVVDPYAQEVQVRATILAGPLAGVTLRGRAPGMAGHQIDPVAEIQGLLDALSGDVRITGVVHDGNATVRLAGRTDAGALDPAAMQVYGAGSAGE